MNIVYPDDAFEEARHGHVHLERGRDGVVRDLFHTITCSSIRLPSFASAMYQIIRSSSAVPPASKSGRITAHARTGIIQSDPMLINFYGPRGTFSAYSLADILDRRWPASFFADKFVFVGTTAAGVDESFWIPFNFGRNGMSGVEIHAHIFNNLMDHSAIRPASRWVRYIAAIGWAVIGYFLFMRFAGPGGLLAGLLSLLTITSVVFALFAAFNLWLAPASLYAATGAAFISAYVFNLQKLKKLYSQAKENWEESFDTIEDAITIHDKDGRIIRANRAANQVFGQALLDFLTRRCIALRRSRKAGDRPRPHPDADEFDAQEVFNPQLGRHLEIESLPRVDAAGRLTGMVQVVRDISQKKQSELEHKELQAQLITAQKMEAIGTLAGGIAHDFNNILAAIMGNTELSLRELPEGNPSKRRLTHVLKACLRAKELILQILAFSRRGKTAGQPQPVQVGLIVTETVKLLRSTLPSTIRIRSRIDSRATVLMDPARLNQIIMNLCTNAKQAMAEKGGILSVSLTDAARPRLRTQGIAKPIPRQGP